MKADLSLPEPVEGRGAAKKQWPSVPMRGAVESGRTIMQFDAGRVQQRVQHAVTVEKQWSSDWEGEK
jgi:hypothetical protein